MDLVLIAAGTALVAVAAQVDVRIWPVPITGQTLAVLLVGSALGALRGSLSLALYAAVGILGLPVFSDASSGTGVILGPTGGYIVGFIFSAAFTGWIAQRSWDRKIVSSILGFLGGTVVTFAFGLPWLAYSLGFNLEQTLDTGLYPFIIGGIIKTVVAAGVITLGWRYFEREDRQRADRETGS